MLISTQYRLFSERNFHKIIATWPIKGDGDLVSRGRLRQQKERLNKKQKRLSE
jgi:hypothetical protein